MNNKEIIETNRKIDNYNLKFIKESIYEKLHKNNNIAVLKQVKKILEIAEKNHL